MIVCTLGDLDKVLIKQVSNSKIYYIWWAIHTKSKIVKALVEGRNPFSILSKWQEDNKLQKWKNTKGEKDRTGFLQTLELKLQSTDGYAETKPF